MIKTNINQENSLLVKSNNEGKDLLKGMVRFDRSLAKNGISFSKFGEDGDLMFDLVVYFANTYQNNLFAHGFLDIDDFCKTMNYSKSNLLKAHKSPRQFEELSVKKNFMKMSKTLDMHNGKKAEEKQLYFYTVLDNALYRLSDEGVSFRFFSKDENYTNSATASIKIIKVLNKKFTSSLKSNNKDLKKLSYSFILDSDFIDNLTRYFVNINLSSVHLLRKSNSIYLYAYLKNLQMDLNSKGFSYTSTIDFDLLIELAQINVENPSDQKKKLINKLNNIFRLTDLQGKVDFIKLPGSKYAFQPVITFYNNLPKLHSKEYIDMVYSAARTRFLHECKSLYHSSGAKDPFVKWFYDQLKDSKSDEYKSLRLIAVNAYNHVCKENFSYNDGRVSRLLTTILQELELKLNKLNQ